MKKFTRALAIITSAVMLISSSAFAASSSKSIDQTNEKLTVTIDCGDAYNG